MRSNIMKKGFTLIELMIVIAIIAIIAAIAIPGLLRARISGNEGSAVGTLRTMSTSQGQAQGASVVDQDGDGTGEFITLGELCGVTNMRGPNNGNQGRTADPSYITKALDPTSTGLSGYGSKSGYFFKVYLPGDAACVSDTGAALNGNVTNANSQEVKWRGYAWPASAKSSGNRAFAVDQAAEVFACGNLVTGTTTPVWNGVLSMDSDDATTSEVVDSVTMAQNLEKRTCRNLQDWKPAS
jgi:prepilin-type N-terminal cleavage/methylation domain-containing protein